MIQEKDHGLCYKADLGSNQGYLLDLLSAHEFSEDLSFPL